MVVFTAEVLAGLDDSTAAFPALVVPGLGHLSVPITPEQSTQLQALCLPALDDTAFDPDNCAVWQLEASRFQCMNPG